MVEDRAGPGGREIWVPIGQGIAGGVAAIGERVNLPDAYADPPLQPGGRSPHRLSHARDPVRARPSTGRPCGGRAPAPRRLDGELFDEDDERLLDAFVGQIAIALRNAQQMEQIEARRKTSELLLDVMKSFSSELEMDALLRQDHGSHLPALQADRSTLFLIDRKTGRSGPRWPRAPAWWRSACRSAGASRHGARHRRDDQHHRRLRRSSLQPGGRSPYRLSHSHCPVLPDPRRPGRGGGRGPGAEQGGGPFTADDEEPAGRALGPGLRSRSTTPGSSSPW